MKKIKRSRCSGCLALCKYKEDDKETYGCDFDYELEYLQMENGEAASPRPLEPCTKTMDRKKFNLLKKNNAT